MWVRGNQRLGYDPENHMNLVATATYAVTFGYAGDGSRLWKLGTNGLLQVWIGGNYEEKSGQILFHIMAGDRFVLTFDKTGTNVVAYYHPDHLHSTAIETDQNGNKSQHYEYMAYGQDRFTESATAFPLSRRYTSQVKDEDTGLYYYGARYYDPQLGSFIQPDDAIPDIFKPQGYNRYSYALDNPFKFVDRNGHAPQLTTITYDPGTGRAQLGYVDQHFGQDYGIGLHTPLEKPTLLAAHDALNAAAEATYDPNVGKLETTQLYLTGAGLTILGVVDLVPGTGGATRPLTRVAERAIEKTIGRKLAETTAEAEGEILSRLGTSRESAARLGRKAAEAEEQIGIHGISTTAGKPLGPASQASREAVESKFPVHDTPTRRDPLHRTVELPKPVTPETAKQFNEVFGRE